MKIPDIPTDNLYKFTSIIGVISLLIFLLGPEYIKYNLKVEEIILSGEIEIASFEIEVNTEDIQTVVDMIDKAKKNKETLSDEIIDLHNKTIETNRSNRKINIRQATQVELNKYKKSQFEKWSKFQIIGVLISTVITLVGFALWYIKVQRPLDKMEHKKNKGSSSIC